METVRREKAIPDRGVPVGSQSINDSSRTLSSKLRTFRQQAVLDDEHLMWRPPPALVAAVPLAVPRLPIRLGQLEMVGQLVLLSLREPAITCGAWCQRVHRRVAGRLFKKPDRSFLGSVSPLSLDREPADELDVVVPDRGKRLRRLERLRPDPLDRLHELPGPLLR